MAKQQVSTHTTNGWTSTQAYVFAVICLVIGVAVGYFVRGSGSPALQAHTEGDGHNHGPAAATMGGTEQITPEQLKHMADKQAEPLLAQLKGSPQDPELLAKVGNVYYDAQQFQEAIAYYSKSLAVAPKDTNVRTDMATAIWYTGDADAAIAEFNKVLAIEPTKGNALFNLGVVKWRGKMDINGAVTIWEKLLKTNPDYPGRDQVEQMLAQAKQHAEIAPGTKTSKAAQ